MLGINEPPVTIKQIEVEIVERALRRGLGRAACRRRSRTGKRVAVVGSGPAGLAAAAAAEPRRARRHRLRARRPHRRAAALRHPRVQAGEAGPRPPARRRCRPRASMFRTNVQRRRRRRRRRAARRLRRDRARRRRDRCRATCRSPAASSTASTSRWSSCRASNRVQQGDLDEPPITARGQARRHHRRRRHRRRLPRHRRTARARRRCTSSRSCRARPTRGADEPVAARGRTIFRVVVGARGRRRAGLRASTPSASSATTTATCAALRAHEVER